jgi:CelD/BcsL family acetyltransferase involved in cellulose biosynthesis
MVKSMPPSLAVDTSGTWDAYLSRLSSRTVRQLTALPERARREAGRVEVSMRQPRANAVDDLLNLFVSVEGSGWKGRQHSSLAARADLRRFFRAYCHRAAERGRLRVSTLSFGYVIGAIELSVEAFNRLWGLKITYNERFAPYAPAVQLAHASVRESFKRGLSSYEFLGAAERWQERWKPERRSYALIAVYPFCSRGICGGLADLWAHWSDRQASSAASSHLFGQS